MFIIVGRTGISVERVFDLFITCFNILIFVECIFPILLCHSKFFFKYTSVYSHCLQHVRDLNLLRQIFSCSVQQSSLRATAFPLAPLGDITGSRTIQVDISARLFLHGCLRCECNRIITLTSPQHIVLRHHSCGDKHFWAVTYFHNKVCQSEKKPDTSNARHPLE